MRGLLVGEDIISERGWLKDLEDRFIFTFMLGKLALQVFFEFVAAGAHKPHFLEVPNPLQPRKMQRGTRALNPRYMNT